jgi:hypothetical protein
MESDMGIHENRKIDLNLKLGWVFLVNIGILLAIASSSSAQNTTSLRRNFPDDPAKLNGNGGGGISLASIARIADNCRGFANTQSNHTITLTQPFLSLDFWVAPKEVNDDPTMLIMGPDGITVCADDELNGRLPKKTLRRSNGRLPKGDYQVWVGSKTANQSFAYTLYLSEPNR